MSSSFIQIEGSVKFGPVGGALVEYGDAISSCVIVTTRDQVAIPGTFGNRQASAAAGGTTREVQLTFMSATAASSFFAELEDAIESDDAELDFEFIKNDAAVGVDNKKYSGTVIVTSLENGGEVGGLRQQSQTWPIKAGTYTPSTTP